jgi:hypothetical protein
VTAPFQLPVQIIQHDVGQDRRQRRALRGALCCWLPDPIDHHPGLQIAPDEPENLAVRHLAGHPRHQHIELNPVKEPVQVDVSDPFPAVLDARPGSLHRLVGGPAGAEPEGRRRELRVEDGREYLRDGLLDQPVQAGGHPQQPLAAPRLGDHHPAGRRGLVGARVQGLADLRPVLAQPRAKLPRGHAIHTRRAPVGLHTPQRPAQIARREQLLPQRHLQAGKDSLPGPRRLAATLRCGAQRDSPSPPSSGPACGMAAITATSTSNPVPPPHLTFGPSRLMHVPPPVLRPLLTSAWSARTSRCGPSARRHDSTTDTQADLPG